MKIGKFVIAVMASVGLCLPALAPTTAAAATRGVPLTCGMVIDHDATVYLKKNLHCPSFGVRVVGVMDGNAYPHVVVDLRGHTLSGTASEDGITAIGSTITWPSLEVKNGRLQGWDRALAGDAGATLRKVVLRDNRIGFWCEGECTVDRSVFSDNTDRGFFVGEGHATISRSVFRRNGVGAAVWRLPYSLNVSRSLFSGNGIGVAGYDGSTLVLSLSTFARNDTGVFYWGVGEEDCVTLVRDRFRHNRIDVDGRIC